MKKNIQAVSLVLIHQSQTLVIQRSLELKVFPGYWGFPGGKIEKGESHWQAIQREIEEELGLLLDDSDEKRLIYLKKFITPDFNPYRFETYFYQLEIDKKPELKLNSEIAFADWFDPIRFMHEEFALGDKPMVPPVQNILLGQEDKKFEAIPIVEMLSGVTQIMPLSNTVPPATRTNAYYFGNPRTLVDPSPKDEEELENLKRSLKDYPVDQVFITHHHGDHHQFLKELVSFLNVPVLCSKLAYELMEKKGRLERWAGITFKFIEDEEVITIDQGKKVRALSVPGHDKSQLAIYREDLSWMIVGDLFQGIGTVVVGGIEGSMLEYFKSLKRVILMNPKVIFPSHGIALGGVEILKKTLRHREQREEEILEFKKQNKSNEEILHLIYAGLPEKLLPFAMANIESHLEKLSIEGRV